MSRQYGCSVFGEGCGNLDVFRKMCCGQEVVLGFPKRYVHALDCAECVSESTSINTATCAFVSVFNTHLISSCD